MKINKRLRKAFTLVELVVVIAIIAILSTVSVVTYFGITSSAKKSVDDQTITQWNQLLLLEEELGNKSETPQEALDIILENGWDVAKLTPTYEGNEILWDQEENRFLILDKDTVTNSRVRNAYESSRKGEYWRFLKDYSEPKGYSVYITDPEFKVSETLIVTAGIDLSRVTEKVDVKYENVSKDQKVILNTNGGTLEVSDANVEVKHFGTASKSTVSSKSYEEKGTVVGDTLVNGGKYIATSSEAEAGTVLVSSKDVELNISASAKVGTVAGTTDEAQAAIKSNTNIPSDKKLDSDTAVVPTTDFAGGLGTENSPYLISTVKDFKNIDKYARKGSYFYKQTNDLNVTSNRISIFQGTYDGANFKLSYLLDEGDFATIFNELNGSSNFININVYMGKTAVSLLSVSNWGTAYDVLFDNITFNSTENLVSANANNFGFVTINALYTNGGEATYTFSNITNNVNLQNEGTCTGILVGSGPCYNSKTTVNVKNIVNNGNLTGFSSVGYLYGNAAYIESVEESGSIFNIENCVNNNILSSTTDKSIVEFAPKLSTLNEKYQALAGGSFLSENYLANKKITVNQNGTEFTLNTTDTSVSYKLFFNVSAIYSTIDGEAYDDSDLEVVNNKETYDTKWYVSNGTKYSQDIKVNTEAVGSLTNSFKAVDKRTAEKLGLTVSEFNNEYEIVVKDDTTYLVFNTEDFKYINSNVSLYVYAYDSNQTLKGTLKIK